ncbi:MAG: Na+/H+ antiporter NhaA [Ilumatobacter sp.]|nr:MAG: Na+/H+ antiporter NhaA [Ilumatobacter sp.]
MHIRPLADFLRRQAGAAALLIVAAGIAMVWANSPWWETYGEFWERELAFTFDGTTLSLSLRDWVNDGLMTLFFFVVGLEIKREVTQGELREFRHAAVPIIGAVGGMVVPAVLFLALNIGGAGVNGWGIPVATDIAIVMGVIALLASRVPSWLKLFLLALAIVDDIGAILVIAIFYSSGVSFGWLAAAIGIFAVALILRPRVPSITVYVVLGVLCWFSLHEAQVHPTLAGVAFGVLAPVTPRRHTGLVDAEELLLHPSVEMAAELAHQARDSVSIVEWLIHRLHPYTSYLIIPIFALANAGVHIPISELGDAMSSTVTWGVILGLVVGKIVGIFGASMLAVVTRVGSLPVGVTPRYLLGASALGGIGFTVSLFVTRLAFTDPDLGRDARLGVLVASLVAAAIGAAILIPGKPPTASAHGDTMSLISAPTREMESAAVARAASGPGRSDPPGVGAELGAAP